MRVPKRILIGATIAVTIGLSGASCDRGGTAISRSFEGAKASPVSLRAFLNEFPKGADLHNELAGAVYAEDIIGMAATQGQCFTLATSTITGPPCGVGTRPIGGALVDREFADVVIDALSTRHFVPEQSPQVDSMYEQFFATFDRFSTALTDANFSTQLTAAGRIAARNNVSYVEYATSPSGQEIAALGDRIGFRRNLARTASVMRASGVRRLVRQASRTVRIGEQRFNTSNRCRTENPASPCRVQAKYLYQVTRTLPPKQVFAQFVAGFDLARSDPRFVGVTLSAPENDPIALRDYDLHMRMIEVLNGSGPPVKLALNAGELAEGLVQPTVLGTHIRKAMAAGASRIGHGSDLAYDSNPQQLLADMTENGTTVEILLTSSEQVLGLSGDDHPFPEYLASNVPTVLSTGAQGVSRIDLTNQYQIAVERDNLTYDQLLALSRQSLESSFLPGESLWSDGVKSAVISECAADVGRQAETSTECAAYVKASPRALAQLKLERRLSAFSREAPVRYTTTPSSSPTSS